MNKGHNRCHVHLGKIEARHSLFGTAIAYDVADLVAFHILAHKLGPGQIGATLSAAGIFSMAEPAVLSKESLPILDEFRRIRLGTGRRCGLRSLPRNAGRLYTRVRRLRRSTGALTQKSQRGREADHETEM